ncbi:contact-dependent growth inhibition system immunity protein [Streptomyces sp. NRRL B-24484]|uniref:contact-dependent growth inhibition system immunity protein n=1 Tax=Streptomyces sp. NRRL B-24484 TaxID=1463833 RepID=UPI0006948CCC|nr:contact-dependent growth inhibition system immunity protein [Streptomyces sp. NRRL B-24484]
MTAEPAGHGRSLDELEGAWPPPAPGATRLITTAHALHRVPLGELGAEGLRLLIGQDIGLPHLVPVALDLLEADPATEGDLYPGDLHDAVAGRRPGFWASRPDLAARLRAVPPPAGRGRGRETRSSADGAGR